MVGSFFETPNALNISLLSTCLMTLASFIRNASESSLRPLGVHFYDKQSMPLSLCVGTVSSYLGYFEGHTPYCFVTGSRLKCKAGRAMCLFTLSE